MRIGRRGNITVLVCGACFVAVVALLAGCNLAGEPPTISVYPGTDDSGTPLDSDHYLIPAVPAVTSVDLFVQVTSKGALNSLHCTIDGVDLAPTATTGGILKRSARFTVAIAAGAHVTLAFKAVDASANETVSVITIYNNPDIIDQVFVAGKSSDQTQVAWVGEPMHLIVARHQDVVGSYDITVVYDGNTYDYPNNTVDPFPELYFPSVAGEYTCTVDAEDPDTHVGESVEFPLYVEHFSVGDSWHGGAGAYPHDASGALTLEVSWAKPADTADVAWVVEVKSDTMSRTHSSGTSASVPFTDVGEYFVRIGVMEPDDLDYSYTAYFPTGYTGKNTDPVAPTIDPAAPGTLSAADGGTWSFDVTAEDPDGDPCRYIVASVEVSIVYSDGQYVWTYGSSNGSFGDGTKGDGKWEFSWYVPGAKLDAKEYVFTFYAQDSFGGYSPGYPVTLTLVGAEP